MNRQDYLGRKNSGKSTPGSKITLTSNTNSRTTISQSNANKKQYIDNLKNKYKKEN